VEQIYVCVGVCLFNWNYVFSFAGGSIKINDIVKIRNYYIHIMRKKQRSLDT
jgi:hypothetical protein